MTLTIVGRRCSARVGAGLLTALALLTAGCYKATGGGWMPSVTGADKASFGFSAMCRTITQPDGSPGAALYDGQLEWSDGPVVFHGNVEPFDFAVLAGRCQDVRQMLAGMGPVQFGGTYRPKPSGDSGFFFMTVIDFGTPGANGDFIQIELFDGQYAGYFNADSVQGGNINVF